MKAAIGMLTSTQLQHFRAVETIIMVRAVLGLHGQGPCSLQAQHTSSRAARVPACRHALP